jgi:hypothetical protein
MMMMWINMYVGIFVWKAVVLSNAASIVPPQYALEKQETFRVAVITAGSIRTFAYVAESWKRYIFAQWGRDVFLFGYVAANKNCPFEMLGVGLMKELATRVEVSYNRSLEITDHEVSRHLHKWYKNNGTRLGDGFEYQRMGSVMARGNVLDMQVRRAKAYTLALRYAREHHVTFDLVCFIRTDSPIYSPTPAFFEWYRVLSFLGDSTNKPWIYSPRICGYKSGWCDRFVVGLPKQMRVFFDRHAYFKVLSWTATSEHNRSDSDMQTVLSSQANSETLLRIWLERINNISHVAMSIADQEFRFSFLTLRSTVIGEYCRKNRIEFLLNDTELWRMRAHIDYMVSRNTAILAVGQEYDAFDLIASPALRCGPVYDPLMKVDCSR